MAHLTKEEEAYIRSTIDSFPSYGAIDDPPPKIHINENLKEYINNQLKPLQETIEQLTKRIEQLENNVKSDCVIPLKERVTQLEAHTGIYSDGTIVR
jgi:predicted ribosome quality control (RQC) complex YloA/Tae2 family protein